MGKQWSLYSVSSLILLVLLKITFDQGHIGLSVFLLFLLLIQVTGTVICVHQKRHKKEEVGTEAFNSEK
ncbi:hypothetical protein [Enterococcus sp. AZ126]|uniref:hypothetical protein n=1 Tax=Enterococcus sp. AZ126 TaxID=2774635 RepID=UPI003F20FAAA